MSNPTRIVIVDDSALYRTAIRSCLRGHDAFDVVGSAADGTEALRQISDLQPDLVILDLEMPALNGLQVLERLRPPRPRVVVFSTGGERGAENSVRALQLGADDVVLKPQARDGIDAIAQHLLPRLRALGRKRPTGKSIGTDTRPADHATRRRLVAIASSTGGPQALAQALAPLRSDFPVPIVIVQHMPALFTRSLAASLDRSSGLQVSEATDGQTLAPGHALLAPGGYHMSVETRDGRAVVRLDQSAKMHGLRPAADRLFPSLASCFGHEVLFAVFTGMGRDGCESLQQIGDRGLACITQEADSCVVYGMPAAVDQAGLSQGHFRPADFAATIHQYQLRW
ncbi:MAG: chemotaxis-specific protein-glutamate methyltransferase CheB [Planctomycetota bacterium]